MRAETATGPFAWDSVSVAADDGVNVIKPNDLAPIDPGRWLRLASPVPPPGAGELHFTLSGMYAGAIVPGVFDPLYIAPLGFTITSVQVMRRTAGLAGSTDIDVTKNGVSILAAPPLSVTAGAGDNATVVTAAFAPGANVFLANDILEVVLVAVETFNPGLPVGPEGLRIVINRS